MRYTSQGLVKYCLGIMRIRTVYMWGGLMRILTKPYINSLVGQYSHKYTKDRIAHLFSLTNKAYGCDCVGLIKSYYFGGVGSPQYDSKKDINTSGMWAVATERGTISTLPEEQGVILYMAGHVGVYIGNGLCIECTYGQHGDGVVKTKVAGRGWTHWLKLPYIDYNNSEAEAQEKKWVHIADENDDCYNKGEGLMV